MPALWLTACLAGLDEALNDITKVPDAMIARDQLAWLSRGPAQPDAPPSSAVSLVHTSMGLEAALTEETASSRRRSATSSR